LHQELIGRKSEFELLNPTATSVVIISRPRRITPDACSTHQFPFESPAFPLFQFYKMTTTPQWMKTNLLILRKSKKNVKFQFQCVTTYVILGHQLTYNDNIQCWFVIAVTDTITHSSYCVQHHRNAVSRLSDDQHIISYSN